MTSSYSGLVGKQTYGFDHSFYFTNTISNSAYGQNSADGIAPDTIIPFQPAGVIFSLTGGSGTIEFSFNGINTHGILTSTTPFNQLYFLNRIISKVWFRVQAGSNGSFVFNIQAWEEH